MKINKGTMSQVGHIGGWDWLRNIGNKRGNKRKEKENRKLGENKKDLEMQEMKFNKKSGKV